MASNIININNIKHVYDCIQDITKNNKKSMQILEPLSTIIRLGIISFKEIGTKIAINNNKLYIQTPNITQGVVRWTYGNNREEVHFLLKPIVRALSLYKPTEDDNLKNIYNTAINGLKFLKKSYNNSSSTLCHALDLYITLIEDTINGNQNMNLEKYSNIDNDGLAESLEISLNTKINLESLFKNVWKSEEITLISGMISLANSSQEKKNYISAIEAILETKDKLSDDIINKTNKLL